MPSAPLNGLWHTSYYARLEKLVEKKFPIKLLHFWKNIFRERGVQKWLSKMFAKIKKWIKTFFKKNRFLILSTLSTIFFQRICDLNSKDWNTTSTTLYFCENKSSPMKIQHMIKDIPGRRIESIKSLTILSTYIQHIICMQHCVPICNICMKLCLPISDICM